jgi:hypothetical protein
LVALAERIELWPIEKLRPYERNRRTHGEAQVDQIAGSMVEFGWTNPILIDENAARSRPDAGRPRLRPDLWPARAEYRADRRCAGDQERDALGDHRLRDRRTLA